MPFELNLERYNFKEHKEFDPSLIRFDEVVRDMCRQNACGQYGKNHMCPPAVKEVIEWKREIEEYEKGVIVTKGYQTESSYDLKAMFEGIKDFQKTLSGLKKDLTSESPNMKHLLLGAGPCLICEKCSYIEGEPCRFPEKAFPSVEACGVDVMSLSKTTGVKYNNGKNTLTYIGVILYK